MSKLTHLPDSGCVSTAIFIGHHNLSPLINPLSWPSAALINYPVSHALWLPEISPAHWVFAIRLLVLGKGNGLWNPDNFFNPESGKFLLVESQILGFRIPNTAQGVWNPTNEWNLEFKFHWQKIRNPVSGIGNPVPGIRNPFLGIQIPRLSWNPLHGASQLKWDKLP